MSKSQSAPVPILLTVRTLDQGGIERDVCRIATNLDRTRFEPHVVSYSDSGMRYEELKRAGVPILHLPVNSFLSLRTIGQAWRLWRYIRKHKIQMLHAWDMSGILFIPVARLARLPVTISSVLGHRHLIDDRGRRMWRYTDRMATALVVNCEDLRRHMIEDEGAKGIRIELCYNGVDTDHFYPLPGPRPAEVAGATLVIGTVCALRQEKALHLLQEAFAKVRGLYPGMKLLIVGSGSELGMLEANAKRLDIVEDCVFVPATTAVADYLRAIDIFVLSSYSEAFSNSLLEAMACGCCPVGSRVGGTPEMIGANEERGLLFTSGDTNDLAAKLAVLIRNPHLRQQLGQKAAAHAKQELNLERNVKRTEQIYESLLHGDRGSL